MAWPLNKRDALQRQESTQAQQRVRGAGAKLYVRIKQIPLAVFAACPSRWELHADADAEDRRGLRVVRLHDIVSEQE